MFVLVCILPLALVLVALGYLAATLGSGAVLPLACRSMTDGERQAKLSAIARRVKAERLAYNNALLRRSMTDEERLAKLSEIAKRVKAERMETFAPVRMDD